MPHRPDPRLTIRLTPEEYAEIRAKAGATPLATFARDLLLEKAGQRRNAPVRAVLQDQAAYARILAMLGTSAAVRSFRDAVRDTADGTVPTSDDTEASLDAVAADISEIKQLLMKALGVAER